MYFIVLFFSRLTHNDYLRIFDKIKKLFPTEPLTVYYIGTIKKKDSPNGKTIPPKGKLIDKAKNLLYKGGFTNKRKGSNNTDETQKKTKIGNMTFQ